MNKYITMGGTGKILFFILFADILVSGCFHPDDKKFRYKMAGAWEIETFEVVNYKDNLPANTDTYPDYGYFILYDADGALSRAEYGLRTGQNGEMKTFSDFWSRDEARLIIGNLIFTVEKHASHKHSWSRVFLNPDGTPDRKETFQVVRKTDGIPELE